MFSRIALRLQEFFTFGSDYTAQKRPSESSVSISSPSKRQRLDSMNKMTTSKEEGELSRPALSRLGPKVSTNRGQRVDSSCSCLNASKSTSVNKSALENKVNGYDFSNSVRNISQDTKFSFDKRGTFIKNRNSEERLRRPSISDRSVLLHESLNGDALPEERSIAVSPSIFKTWTGFTCSTPLAVDADAGRRRPKAPNADSYLHKRIVPKDLAIKQCFRMDEKRRYKEMLARYVSPTVLEMVDFYGGHTNTGPMAEVIVISDSESTSERRVGSLTMGETMGRDRSSPVVLGSAGESPCSSVGLSFPVKLPLHPTSTRLTNPGSRATSISSSSSVLGSSNNNFDYGQWKSLERKMERASSLLDELVQPVGGRSSAIRPSGRQRVTEPRKEVIVIKDDDKSTARGGVDRWRTKPRVETICVDDSDEEARGLPLNATNSGSWKTSTTAKETYARPGLRCLKDFEVTLKSSPFLKNNYLKNLLDQTEEQARKLRVKETEAELDEMRKMREEREAKCNEKITNLIRLTRRLPVPLEETYIEVEDEEEEEDDDDVIVEETMRDDWPQLTEQQEEEVNRAFRCRRPEQVLADGFKLQITARDIATLQGKNWLNDEVINFYFNMIVDRSQRNPKLPSVYAFNTFFYPKVMSGGQKAVRRWTKSADIFGHSYIILPVHLGVHWCLAVIDFPKKEIRYYDSMGGNNNACLDALLRYLVDEMQDKKQQVFDTKGWKKINVKDIPQQMNGSDCGMFSCKFAEYITRNASITFNQSHMPYFRRRMVYEILTKQLM